MNKNKTWEVNTTKFYETHDLIINGEIIELFTYRNGNVNILGNFLVDCSKFESAGSLDLDRLEVEKRIVKQCEDEIKELQNILNGLGLEN